MVDHSVESFILKMSVSFAQRTPQVDSDGSVCSNYICGDTYSAIETTADKTAITRTGEEPIVAWVMR